LADSRTIDPAAENLYLAKVASPQAGPAQLGLKKFFDLIPNLKASDFDYIIFDMPHLEQTSPSWGMAPFMDKLLLIVEAEKTHRAVISRGYHKLVSERANVSVVFNKARTYLPRLLDGEYGH
jgi:Mrp family chromosome partitioning ATPase